MKAALWTQEQVADLLELRRNRVSDLLAGQTTIAVGDLEKLISTLQPAIDPDYFDWLRQLRRDQQKRGYWSAAPLRTYDGRIRNLIEGESRADLLQVVQTEEIPVHLRTPAYIRARLTQQGKAVGEVVDAYMERQEPLKRAKKVVRYEAVLSETCLTTEYGSPEVMAEQMDYLRAFASRPNCRIQILSSKGRRTVIGAPVMLLRIPSHRKSPAGPLRFAYYNNQWDVRYIDDPVAVDKYAEHLGNLFAAALSPEDSLLLMDMHAENYRSAVAASSDRTEEGI